MVNQKNNPETVGIDGEAEFAKKNIQHASNVDFLKTVKNRPKNKEGCYRTKQGRMLTRYTVT